MAYKNNADHGPEKPNVSASRTKPFQRGRLYLQLVTIFAVALAFCLGVSIFLKVDAIVVSGAERYSPWTVAQASGIQEGDNLLFFGRARAQVKIKQALPYVNKVRIGINLPGKPGNILFPDHPAGQKLRAAGNGLQRGLQFMGHIGGELPAHLFCVLRFRHIHH